MYSLVVLDNETTFTNPIQSPNIEDLHRAFLVGMRQMRHGLLLCWAGLSLQGCHDPHDVRMPIGHAVQRWQNKNLVSFLETHQEDLYEIHLQICLLAEKSRVLVSQLPVPWRTCNSKEEVCSDGLNNPGWCQQLLAM